ncbi:MAG: arginine--tRNA ligase, partial [Thermoleophilia bacterium]
MPDAPLLLPIRDTLAAAATAVAGAAPPAVPLAPPASPEMGDIATPVAMAMAKAARRPPREIAEAVVARLREDAPDWLAGAEVAGPGFINLTLSPAWFAGAVAAVEAEGDRHGAGRVAEPLDVLVEFVSANPTGPLHVGHARQAALGDSLARVLAFAGHRVAREYYVNDHGRQMRMFGASVAARYAQLCGEDVAVPEDGYHGDYVTAIAETVRGEIGDAHAGDATTSEEALDLFTRRGEELMLASIFGELERFRVTFDRVFSERTLHEGGLVTAGVAALRDKGDAYEADGALWFRTTDYGDAKDRVLVRADGEPTYLAADVAYHLDKAGRGHDRLVDVLGADHHGYIARLRAVLEAGGHDPEGLEVALVQLVSLLERGEAKK